MPSSSFEMDLENIAWFVGSKVREIRDKVRKMVKLYGFAMFMKTLGYDKLVNNVQNKVWFEFLV